MNWNHITVGQYQAAYTVLHTQYDDIIDMHIDYLSALTGANREDLLKMQRDKFLQLVKEYEFVKSTVTIKKAFPKYILVKGKVFKPVNKVEKLTGGQYLDLMNYAKGSEENIIQNIHNILAVLCLPWKPFVKYNGTAHPVIARFLQENMTMAQGWPIALFFWNYWQELMPAILENLKEELSKMKIALPMDLTHSTAGS